MFFSVFLSAWVSVVSAAAQAAIPSGLNDIAPIPSSSGTELMTNQPPRHSGPRTLKDALPPETWEQVEESVDRALAWLASQQQADGSFPAPASAQPAATSFAVLAFLSRGHQPGPGPFGAQIESAIDFVLSCQKPDGLLSHDPALPPFRLFQSPHTASYNHAIGGLMLGEAYGHVGGDQAKAVKQAIEKALQFTRQLQLRPTRRPGDAGGWGYVVPGRTVDTDLSVTGWQLMFLRSAKGAEFDVPEESVVEALDFVRRCWNAERGEFRYRPPETVLPGNNSTRGLMAIGILSLSMAGQHDTPMARTAGDWLVTHPFRAFGETRGAQDRFYYSIHACSQAAVQLGGEHWEKIYPPLVDVLLASQQPDGSWPPEPKASDATFGNAITTSMAVLSLTPPYQLLPVYQR